MPDLKFDTDGLLALSDAATTASQAFRGLGAALGSSIQDAILGDPASWFPRQPRWKRKQWQRAYRREARAAGVAPEIIARNERRIIRGLGLSMTQAYDDAMRPLRELQASEFEAAFAPLLPDGVKMRTVR